MNLTVLSVVLAISLGMVLGSPLQACDKLKIVKEGADNHSQYLVKLKDSDNYTDAEYIINLVNRYQTMLEQYASNVHEPSVKSQLEKHDAAGVLYGTLSQQALILVCSESRVELILPDYLRSHINPKGSGMGSEDLHAAECFKLVLNEPYNGSNYSVTFKGNISLNTLYRVITKMELAKLSDNTLSFNYYHSIRKGKRMTMIVRMNIKALHMVCKERKVKQIKPNYDTSHSVIAKRNTEAIPGQDIMIPTTLNGHCSLLEHDEEFPTFIFVYNKTANLDEIIKSVKEYNRNSARVLLAQVIEQLNMVIFQMSRAAYLQACRNPEITLVEYAEPIILNSSATTPIPKTSSSKRSLPTKATSTDICQHIDSLQDEINTYTVLLNIPWSVEDRRKRCSKLIKNLTKRSKNTLFYAVTYPQQSCQINENDIKLVTKLNLKALKYVCAFKGLQISVTQS